jgi:hypothetical protein
LSFGFGFDLRLRFFFWWFVVYNYNLRGLSSWDYKALLALHLHGMRDPGVPLLLLLPLALEQEQRQPVDR